MLSQSMKAKLLSLHNKSETSQIDGNLPVIFREKKNLWEISN